MKGTERDLPASCALPAEPSGSSAVVRRAEMGEKTTTDVLEPKRVVRDPSDIQPGRQRRREGREKAAHKKTTKSKT